MGRAATAQSRSPSAPHSATTRPPLAHDHRRSRPGPGAHLELVHQPTGSGQAETHPLRSRIPVLESSLQIADTRTFVARLHANAHSAVAVDDPEEDLALAGVAGDIARHL